MARCYVIRTLSFSPSAPLYLQVLSVPVILHALEQQSSLVLQTSPWNKHVGALWKHRLVSHSQRPFGASLHAVGLVLSQQMPCHDTVLGIEVWQHHGVTAEPI